MDKELFKVLLVDDDEDDYIVTRDLLSEVVMSKYELEWVATYEAALEAMKRNNHDVYLLDYRLGERTGLELLREMMENGCKVPIILMTGQGDHTVDMEAMKAGAADFLVKGKIDLSSLERSIRYAIERKRTEEQILYMAYYDNLTGLPNSRLFKDRLQQAMMHVARHQRLSAVLFLDLDNFKYINDTLGHTIGDLLLKEVADRLQKCLRKSDSVAYPKADDPNDTVSRLGGDEFIILLLEIKQAEDAAKVAQRVLETLSLRFMMDRNEVYITASIGIAVYPFDGEDIDALLKNADTAMYHAKGRGKNNYQFYKQSMNAAALTKLTLEGSLRKALDRGEFLLHYQPQMDIRTKKIVGMEALIRWQHPERGLVPPLEFIPLAEEIGLIIPISEWVLRAVCAQNKAWQEEGFHPIRVSANLSSQHFKHPSLVPAIVKALDDTGLSPRYLEIEITESIFMENIKEVISRVNEIKSRGIRLTMDDFGTGYSSLSYLKNLPLDAIKIDRSFVKDIQTDPGSAAIVKAIIAMSNSLNLDVVAEGVETEQQLSFLLEQGCNKMQGYLLSRPLPPQEASKFLTKEKEETK
jgi:diguanylate cyclase (GGDEF)-like protein